MRVAHQKREMGMVGPARKVVARSMDGALIKGYTYDFSPGRRRFHVFAARNASSDPVPVMFAEQKAVFFVRDLAGNPTHRERKAFLPGQRPTGRKIEVTFKDNEVLVGSTEDDTHLSGPGFRFIPADPTSNNIEVYAPSAAVRRVRHLPVDRPSARRVSASPMSAPPADPPLPRRILAWLLRPLRQPGSRVPRHVAT
jgi:hypothetical protein